MNKKKVSEFLHKLMLERKMTNKDLQDNLNDRYNNIDIRTIKKWLDGSSSPNIDDFVDLSDIFDVSIDELIEGEKRKNIDFKKKYFIANDEWVNNYPSNDLYKLNQEQIILVSNTFERLLTKIITSELTRTEEDEFKFLFDNFYELSRYCMDIKTSQSNDTYFVFIDTLRRIINKCETKDTKRWEAKRLVKPISSIAFPKLSEDILDDEGYLAKRFDNLEFWEKDMIFSTLQVIDPIRVNPERFGTKFLEHYNKTRERKFCPEKTTKEIIKFLIEHGAKLNPYYFNLIKISEEKKRLIDRVEALFCKFIKPLSTNTCIDGEQKIITFKNTKKNRFICDCFYSLKVDLDLDMNPDELYDLILNEKEWNNFLLKKLSNDKKIDTNRGKHLNDVDLRYYYRYTLETLDKFKKNEEIIEKEIIEYENIVNELKNGKTTYSVFKKETIGGCEYQEMMEYREYWNTLTDLNNIKSARLIKETEDLLKDLDVLSVEEIRSKYFPTEEISNG